MNLFTCLFEWLFDRTQEYFTYMTAAIVIKEGNWENRARLRKLSTSRKLDECIYNFNCIVYE